ncbi:MAG: CocE/NonD family hydrolase [Sarcina sp.]
MSKNLTPTNFFDVKSGFNKITVATPFYGLQEMIMEKDIPIQLDDGIKIYINIFRPNKTGKFPVIISADAYGKDTLSMFNQPNMIPTTLGLIKTSDFAVFESPDPGFWVPNDYIVIKVALRGSTNSEGTLHPWTMAEAKDYYEVIEWAVTQQWSTSNIGTNGVSYLAVTQWKMASLAPPHLKAMIPWEGLNDVYREAAYHGGIPETNFFPSWAKGLLDRWPNNSVDDMRKIQKEHPLIDEYWEENMPNLSNIKIPMLVCASWSTVGLHNRGSFEGFKQASSKEKWLYVHGRKEWETYYSRESLELQKLFFDYYLKGIDNNWIYKPKVQYELRESFYQGEKKTTNDWPLQNSNYVKLYLNGEDMSLQSAPLKKETILSYNTDINHSKNNELKFKITFKEKTEITGYMKLKLWVSAEIADDMDIFVSIKKFDKNNKEVHFADFNHIENGQVSSGWLRVSHRELDLEKSKPYQPWLKHKNLLKLKKDEKVPVEIEIWPSSTLFNENESLALIIKGKETLNESIGIAGYAHNDTVNSGIYNFYIGGESDSHLLVPIIRE